ncbi:hypothetical protein RUM44_003968 [Polyplax serrata]|uniref:Uncharacterized protein n=1 Tax=Polyplax serrata TaxID=468196 RepID=A0ABR1B1H2_POLSC
MATEPFPPPTNTQPAAAAPYNPVRSGGGGDKAPLTFGSEANEIGSDGRKINSSFKLFIEFIQVTIESDSQSIPELIEFSHGGVGTPWRTSGASCVVQPGVLSGFSGQGQGQAGDFETIGRYTPKDPNIPETGEQQKRSLYPDKNTCCVKICGSLKDGLCVEKGSNCKSEDLIAYEEALDQTTECGASESLGTRVPSLECTASEPYSSPHKLGSGASRVLSAPALVLTAYLNYYSQASFFVSTGRVRRRTEEDGGEGTDEDDDGVKYNGGSVIFIASETSPVLWQDPASRRCSVGKHNLNESETRERRRGRRRRSRSRRRRGRKRSELKLNSFPVKLCYLPGLQCSDPKCKFQTFINLNLTEKSLGSRAYTQTHCTQKQPVVAQENYHTLCTGQRNNKNTRILEENISFDEAGGSYCDTDEVEVDDDDDDVDDVDEQ